MPSGSENVGLPAVPPVDAVVAPPALVISPVVAFPPADVLWVASPVVAPLPPPEPAVTPVVVELVDVTDTMPTVIVAVPVDERPVVDPALVVVIVPSPPVSAELPASLALLADSAAGSALQLVSPSSRTHRGIQAALLKGFAG